MAPIHPGAVGVADAQRIGGGLIGAYSPFIEHQRELLERQAEAARQAANQRLGVARPAQKDPAYPDDNPKTVVGLTKPQFRNIPPVALLEIGRAMRDGAEKYGKMNWRDARVTASTYYDAMMRHLLAWWDGEELAADSKVHHLAHVAGCCAILLDAASQGMLNDDRPSPGLFHSFVERHTEGRSPA